MPGLALERQEVEEGGLLVGRARRARQRHEPAGPDPVAGPVVGGVELDRLRPPADRVPPGELGQVGPLLVPGGRRPDDAGHVPGEGGRPGLEGGEPAGRQVAGQQAPEVAVVGGRGRRGTMPARRSSASRAASVPMAPVSRLAAGPARARAFHGYRGPMPPDSHTLAGTEVTVPLLGVGTWAWGDRRRGAWAATTPTSPATPSGRRGTRRSTPASRSSTPPRSTAVGRASGSSARCWPATPRRAARVVIATKFMPSPWKLNVRSALLTSLRASLDRLGVASVDLYQIHGPISLRSHARTGRRTGGRSRRGPGPGRRACRTTRSGRPARWPPPLSGAACAWPPTRSSSRCCAGRPRRPGLLAACADLGVVPLAYSPIGQGRLTGKYSAATRPPASGTSPTTRWRSSTASSASCGPSARRTVASSPSQVALNWVIAKGAVPIPGAKNRHQAEENAGALGWHLDGDEVARLDRAALPGIRSLAEPGLAARLSAPRRVRRRGAPAGTRPGPRRGW